MSAMLTATATACGNSGDAALDPMPAGAIRTTGPHFHIDTAPTAACATGATCTVLAELTALDGYHVNRDYPFRFLLAPESGFTRLADPAIRFANQHTMRMSLPARRDRANTPFAGTLKLSVCNDDECLVESVALSVNIP